MLIFLVWFADIIDGLKNVSIAIIIISVIAIFVNIMLTVDDSEGTFNITKGIKRYIKTAIYSLIISTSIVVLMPQKNTYYTMMGIYAGEKVVDATKDSEIFRKALNVIDLKLDEMTRELKGSNNKADISDKK